MFRSIHHVVALSLTTASLLVLWPGGRAVGQTQPPGSPAVGQTPPPGTKVTCQWGKPQKMTAIPGCGVPRQLRVTPPPSVERMMFARDDNPTLKRYMYRSRAIGAPVKTFRRMINVSKTDLVLCPSDFQKARILSFRVVRGRTITARPTCELGPSGGGTTPAAMAMTPGMGTAMTPAMGSGGARKAGMAGMGSVTEVIERDNPVRQRDLVKLRRAIKMDSLARLLGLLGLLLGLGAVVGVVVLAITLGKRMKRLESERDKTRD